MAEKTNGGSVSIETFEDLVKELRRLNPDTNIYITKPNLDSEFGQRIIIDGPSIKKVPKGFYYNEKNGITNKHNVGPYMAVAVNALDDSNRDLILTPAQEAKRDAGLKKAAQAKQALKKDVKKLEELLKKSGVVLNPKVFEKMSENDKFKALSSLLAKENPWSYENNFGKRSLKTKGIEDLALVNSAKNSEKKTRIEKKMDKLLEVQSRKINRLVKELARENLAGRPGTKQQQNIEKASIIFEEKMTRQITAATLKASKIYGNTGQGDYGQKRRKKAR